MPVCPVVVAKTTGRGLGSIKPVAMLFVVLVWPIFVIGAREFGHGSGLINFSRPRFAPMKSYLTRHFGARLLIMIDCARKWIPLTLADGVLLIKELEDGVRLKAVPVHN